MAMKQEHEYIDRELSWLSFNERVLQEAADPLVPLGERLNFLAIFSSNLDEFFRVRVASLRSLLRLKKKRVEQLDFKPARLLREIHDVVTAQQERFGHIFRNDLLPALEEHGIRLITEAGLTADQQETVADWFDQHVLPLIEPIVLDDGAAPPFLPNRAICLAVELWPSEGRGVAAVAPEYALIQVPSPPLPRFLALDAGERRQDVIFLDDVIRANLPRLFPTHVTGAAYAIKLTRDAELNLEDEFDGDIVASIRKSLKKREQGPPCRFLFDLQAPVSLTKTLRRLFELEEEDMVPGGRYHNLHDLRDLPRGSGTGISYSRLDPLPHPDLADAVSLIEAIEEKDRLLHFPYQRFDHVIDLLNEAGNDPDVEEIWITLYRVASDSAVAEAMIRAANAGKRVTAFVELMARFDEESNLTWAERMEEAGVHTIYSLPGLKVHAKLALIVRRGDRPSIAYLGTGNFNERTARVYTDLALLTADPRITNDVRNVFAFLSGEEEEPPFDYLLVAPFNLRKRFYRLIDREAEVARAGGTGQMLLKMNSLEDGRIIERLYRARSAGVSIDLVVRGIFCMSPGKSDRSDNVRARSIVDRFLEHARIFVFGNRGEPQYYLASADWMTRNLSRRVEVAFPILDPSLCEDIATLMKYQLEDNVKARILDSDMSNSYVQAGEPKVRAQVATYRFLANRTRTRRPVATTVTAAADGTLS